MAIQAGAWGVFFIYCLVPFRARVNPQPFARGLKPTLPILAFVVIGDVLLLATSALPAWLARSTPPDASSMPFEVCVVAEQFVWNVHYPGPDRQFGPTTSALISATNPLGIDRQPPAAHDDIGLQNNLTVPVGRPVVVHLSSCDVVHSFTLNEMRVRQDATPGLSVRTWFTQLRQASGRLGVHNSVASATIECVARSG